MVGRARGCVIERAIACLGHRLAWLWYFTLWLAEQYRFHPDALGFCLGAWAIRLLENASHARAPNPRSQIDESPHLIDNCDQPLQVIQRHRLRSKNLSLGGTVLAESRDAHSRGRLDACVIARA